MSSHHPRSSMTLSFYSSLAVQECLTVTPRHMGPIVPKPAARTATTVAGMVIVPSLSRILCRHDPQQKHPHGLLLGLLLVLRWLEQCGVVELVEIEPLHVAAYVETLQNTA